MGKNRPIKSAFSPPEKKTVGQPFRLKNNQEVKFRQYLPEDKTAVLDLHETALRDLGTFDETSARQDYDLHDIELQYIGLGGDFLVGTLDNEIVAMGAFRHMGKAGEVELKRMRVKPELQGQGIGTKLLELLEDIVRQKGYKSIILDTVNQTPAQKMYEQFGYRETGRETRRDREQVFYRKEL